MYFSGWSLEIPGIKPQKLRGGRLLSQLERSGFSGTWKLEPERGADFCGTLLDRPYGWNPEIPGIAGLESLARRKVCLVGFQIPGEFALGPEAARGSALAAQEFCRKNFFGVCITRFQRIFASSKRAAKAERTEPALRPEEPRRVQARQVPITLAARPPRMAEFQKEARRERPNHKAQGSSSVQISGSER